MFYIDVESQVVYSLWRHLDREERKDGEYDEDDEESDGEESDEAGDDE